MALADDAGAEVLGEAEHRLDLVLDHATRGDARPVRDDHRHRLLIDGREDHRTVALQLRELSLKSRLLAHQLVAIDGVEARRRSVERGRRDRLVALRAGCRVCGGTGLAQLGADGEDAVDQRLLALPARLQPFLARPFGLERGLDLGGSRLQIDAHRRFAADDLALGLERLDVAPAVLDFGRHAVLADGHARAGGVEQADRLVGQLTIGDEALARA